MKQVFLALGANLGNTAVTFERALALIEQDIGRISKSSKVYLTRPLADPRKPLAPQPDYRNAVVEVESDLSPEQILARILNIEHMLGRVRASGTRWSPRIIDIDLLLVGSMVSKSDDLTLPHPEIVNRDFVLVPLLEVAPTLIDPSTGVAYAQALKNLESSGRELFIKRVVGELRVDSHAPAA